MSLVHGNDDFPASVGCREVHLTPVPSSGPHDVAATAVVTGRHELLPEVVIALKEAGLDVHAAEVHAADLPGGLPAASIHCYLQMPPPTADEALGPLGRVRAAAERLRERFDALARIAPLLAPTATVLLVADDSSGPSAGALSLLADALQGDHPQARVFVLDPSYSATEIAERARRETAPSPPWSSYVGVAAGLAYTDWRDEILALDA